MDTIVRLTGDDFQEAMEAMGEGFGFSPSRDFPMLLPQIYRPTDELMQAIYAIRRDGRIVAAVGVHPRDWQVGDTTLKLGGIGGVCTLKEYRGQGMMKALMERAVSDMKSEGFHLSWLGGQRQRYQYYGYERCGYGISYRLGSVNLRHARIETPDIRFEPMGKHYADRVAVARGYHESRRVHVIRSQEDFVLYLLSGYNQPWFALDSNDRVIGYLSTSSGRNTVMEIASETLDTTIGMLAAWSRKIEDAVHVEVQPDDIDLSHALGTIAERATISSSGNWQVFDWEKTLTALMQVKLAASGLAEGNVRLKIGDATYLLEVSGASSRCVLSDDPADLELSTFEAHRALFGPSRPSDVAVVPESARVIESWAPFPLGFLRADCV